MLEIKDINISDLIVNKLNWNQFTEAKVQGQIDEESEIYIITDLDEQVATKSDIVQSDYDVFDPNNKAFIQNKPFGKMPQYINQAGQLIWQNTGARNDVGAVYIYGDPSPVFENGKYYYISLINVTYGEMTTDSSFVTYSSSDQGFYSSLYDCSYSWDGGSGFFVSGSSIAYDCEYDLKIYEASKILSSTPLTKEIDKAYLPMNDIAVALGGAKIQTGSYTGTGTEGSSNPNRLTFNFVPKMVIVANTGSSLSYYSPSFLVWVGQGGDHVSTGTGNIFSLSNKTLSWYGPAYTGAGAGTYAANQFNTSGTKYYWVAIG